MEILNNIENKINDNKIVVKKNFASEEMRNNLKKTLLEKYGVENASQSKELQEKRAESMKIMFEKKGVVMKRYNFEFLEDYCKKNNIILLNDYSTTKLNKDCKIKSKCLKCEDGICEKSFHNFIINPYCPKCTSKKRLETLEENNSKKYGVKMFFN